MSYQPSFVFLHVSTERTLNALPRVKCFEWLGSLVHQVREAVDQKDLTTRSLRQRCRISANSHLARHLWDPRILQQLRGLERGTGSDEA